MITGDKKETAVAVAKQIGLINAYHSDDDIAFDVFYCYYRNNTNRAKMCLLEWIKLTF